MADERIDIEVNDKVDANVPKKIREIADAADKGFTYVERLKRSLASINTSAVSKLAAASNATTNALAREMAAQAKLTAARGQAAVANAKAATEAQRLATETARTEAAQQRAATAASNAARAALQLEAAQARAAGGVSNLAARAHSLKAALDPAYAAQSKFNAEVNEAKTLYNAGAINIRTYTAAVAAAQGRLDATKAAQDRFNASVAKGSAATKLAGHHQANLVAQINDIGVSLASGQNPFIVLIQQGSQLQDLSMRVEGGFKTLAAAVLRMVAPFAAAAAVFGVLAAKMAMFKNEINDEAGLKEYAKTLGLTAKEMKKLEDVTVTWGDLASGVWATVKEAMNLDSAFSSIMDAGKTAVDFIWNTFKNFSFGLQGLMTGLFELIRQLFTRFPAIIGDAVLSAVNLTIDGINWLARKSNEIVGTSFGQIDNISNRFAGTMSDVFTATGNAAVAGFRNAEAGYDAFVNRVTQNTIAASRKRLRAQADALKEARGAGPKGKEDKTAENRAHALDMVNLKLDDELKRMRLLKDERAVQQRMDQIEEQLAQKRITLTDTERTAIEGKVRAIEAFKYVQAEMDRIYEEATGPQRTWAAAQEAATKLLTEGKITLDQYNQELAKSGRTFREATDPLFQFEENLAAAQRTSGLYGDALERANYLESIRQALVAQGYEGDRLANELASARVQNLLAENAALQQKNYLTQQAGSVASGIVDPLRQDQTMLENKQAYYDELNRMADEYNLSEANRKKALAALDRQYLELQMSDYSSFFNTLSGLASSGYGELAAIGKAAAITQATINMYVAASEALKLPFPANLPAIAQVIAQGASLIGQIRGTNAGSFANGGQFMVEGKSGVDANNINMNVTRGERVTVETPAQQRANDKGGNSGEPPVVNLKSVNVIDPRMMLDALDTAEGDKVFVNKIETNAAQIRSVLGV